MGEAAASQLAQAKRLEGFQQKFGANAGGALWQDFLERNDPEAPTTEIGQRFPLDRPPAHLAPDATALPDPGSVTYVNDVAPASGPAGLPLSAPAGLPRAAVASGASTAASRAAATARGLLAFPHEESNALLIAGRHTASGHPIAVMGPQVGYFNPQILMEEDVHGPGIDARGAAFDGINLYVELGRGVDYSWSATSAGQDITHVFAVPLCNQDGSKPSQSSTSYMFRGHCTPMNTLTSTESWTPNPGDMTPAGSQTVTVQRTALGIVIARARIAGQPVAYTSLRTTYFHEIDSALGFHDFNDPGAVHDAQSFQRAAYKIGYTFNWLYADDRDITLLNSGNNPAYDPRVDPVLPTAAKYEWQRFNPQGNTAAYTPFNAHPQALNPDYLVSWNNKPAPGYGAGDTPVYRSQLLEDRVRGLIAHGRKATLPQLISAMEDAGTVDLRANRDLPLALKVLGPQSDPQLATAVSELSAWVTDGSHRIDRARSGTYAHSDAIAILDAWWPLLVKGEFAPTLGNDLYNQIFAANGGDDPPNQRLGSAYNSEAYGFVNKDLRSVLGLPVRGPFSRVYCGGGSLTGCRSALTDTLRQALTAAANRNALYPGNSGCSDGDQACADRINFRAIGAVSQPLMAWVNRPTYQQALEILGHRPRPGVASASPPSCASHRTLVIHLRLRPRVRARTIVVYVGGHRVHTFRGDRRRVPISLRGRSAGVVRVLLLVSTTTAATTCAVAITPAARQSIANAIAITPGVAGSCQTARAWFQPTLRHHSSHAKPPADPTPQALRAAVHGDPRSGGPRPTPTAVPARTAGQARRPARRRETRGGSGLSRRGRRRQPSRARPPCPGSAGHACASAPSLR